MPTILPSAFIALVWRALLVSAFLLASGCATAGRPLWYLSPRDVYTDSGARQLAVAASRGDVRSIERLVHDGVDPNSRGLYGTPPAYFALKSGSEAGLDALIRCGADVNLKRDDGTALIHVAALLVSDPGILQILIDRGANLSALGGMDGKSALHLSIGKYEDRGTTEKVKALLRAGAGVNERDTKWGETPLMTAAIMDRYDIAYLLLENGADPNIKNNAGATFNRFVSIGKLPAKETERIAWREKVRGWLLDKGYTVEGW